MADARTQRSDIRAHPEPVAPPPPPPPRPRARTSGVVLGWMEPGPENAITDVGDVRVGHVTLLAETHQLDGGVGPVRTGVTVVLPHAGNVFREKVVAAAHVINAFVEAPRAQASGILPWCRSTRSWVSPTRGRRPRHPEGVALPPGVSP
jgi:hypothetical protein